MSAGSARAAKPAALRLFFAVWPAAAVAAELARWALAAQRVAGGRPVPAERVHLTLAFLGVQGPERMDAAVAAARGVRGAAHEIEFAQACYRARQRIVWAEPAETPAALSALAGALARALRAAGFELETRPFAAHVTLLRDARGARALPPLPPRAWQVGEFTLVRSTNSERGLAYEVLERFPLDSSRCAVELA